MKAVAIDNHILLTEVSRILSEGSSVVLSVRGFSMRPFLFGDRDSVVLLRKDSYEPGDMVLAQIAPERWVLHRLVEAGERVTLKGDGNLDGVEHCAMSDIVGYVTEIQRPGGGKVDTQTAFFARVSVLWRRSPRLFRRIILKILRMTVK